jgi:hypothetical protein
MRILDRIRNRGKGLDNPDNERPIKTIQTGANSWQIVFADE